MTAEPLPRVNADFLVRPRLLRLLDQWSPITLILAPSGAGKAVLAVQWADHARAEGHDVLWFDGEVDEPDDVVAALARHAGVPFDGDRSEMVRRLRRELRGLERRLAVVINNAEPLLEALGGELVDLVRDCRNVHLVPCLRRRLDPVAKALLEAETLVVGLGDLQFDASEVQELARKHGLELSTEEAEQIRASVGGWAALVRTGFESLTGPDHRRVTVWADRHVAWLLAVNVVPVLPPSALAAICRASLVEQPTYGAVLAATGPLDESARAALESIGILDPLVSEGEPLVRLPPLMADFFRGSYDARKLGPAAGVHHRVADFWLAAGEVRLALRQALVGQCWGLAVEIVEDHWWESFDDELPTIPVAEVRGFPRAEVARQVALPDDRTPPSPATRAAEADLRSGPVERLAERVGDPDALALLTLLAVRDRVRGDHAGALDLAHRAEIVLGAGVEAGGASPAVRRAALEAGRARLLSGDLVAAARVLRVGDGPPRELALCAAVSGDRATAAHWLEKSDHTGVAARIAAVFAALRALDRQRTAELLASLRADGVERDDLWPLVAWLEAQHALAWGGRRRMRAELAAARDSVPWLRATPWMQDLLVAAEADLCISLGRTAVAARMLAEREAGSAQILVSRARLERVVGRPEPALALLDEAAAAGFATSALEVEKLVLRAWCLDGKEAAAALASAVRAARRDRLVLPFALVPTELLACHARQVSGLTAIIALLREADVRAPYDVVDELPMLTPREAAVLAELTRGLSLEEIGRELFVSRNTVKSQAASLYRKLRAGGRDEAVAKAGRMGLLD